jgi:ABC-2 type transport system permease protein
MLRQIFTVALLQCRLVLRSKAYLILMFAMPLLITAVFAWTAPDGAADRAIGFTVMFVMMTVTMMGGTIQQERRTGTLGRVLSSPLSRPQVQAGYLLSFVLTGLGQFIILAVVSALLFGVQWGPPLPLLATAAATVMSAAGLGLLLAAFMRTSEQHALIGTMVSITASMLGGVYWPASIMTENMQRIGRLTPIAWALDGLKEVSQVGGAPILPLAVMLGMTLVTATVGLWRTRWE